MQVIKNILQSPIKGGEGIVFPELNAKIDSFNIKKLEKKPTALALFNYLLSHTTHTTGFKPYHETDPELTLGINERVFTYRRLYYDLCSFRRVEPKKRADVLRKEIRKVQTAIDFLKRNSYIKTWQILLNSNQTNLVLKLTPNATSKRTGNAKTRTPIKQKLGPVKNSYITHESDTKITPVKPETRTPIKQKLGPISIIEDKYNNKTPYSPPKVDSELVDGFLRIIEKSKEEGLLKAVMGSEVKHPKAFAKMLAGKTAEEYDPPEYYEKRLKKSIQAKDEEKAKAEKKEKEKAVWMAEAEFKKEKDQEKVSETDDIKAKIDLLSDQKRASLERFTRDKYEHKLKDDFLRGLMCDYYEEWRRENG